MGVSDAEKEQIKLTATDVNGLALAVFAVGGIAPVVSALYSAAPLGVPVTVVIATTVICFGVSGGLHLAARRHLMRLNP